ncbi:MAG TPA: 16S rRNA (cytidine(1402)-2'-O)-methyltransferase [Acidimicrobiia bacterium]|nr:16S rRNA (cytidine(1402)-2'-O)-methyltransferase [Acidimicrobiia bacterium]
MPGTLIVCATPIGNLADASPRLAQTLATSDVIYCEDTRRSRVLLDSLGVKKPLRSYFVGNEAERQNQLAADLEAALTVALLTDAGSPAISDPGWSAVNAARRVGARVTVVPGPSALTASLAVSGFPSERVVFEGFLPRRGRERQERLHQIAHEHRTMVLFVGASHLLADLEALAEIAPDRPLCVARELTKKFEEVLWFTCSEALEVFAKRDVKGEFTLVLSAVARRAPDIESGIEAVLDAMAGGQTMTTAVRLVAADLGLPRRQLYETVLAKTRDTTTGR